MDKILRITENTINLCGHHAGLHCYHPFFPASESIRCNYIDGMSSKCPLDDAPAEEKDPEAVDA